MPKYREDWWTVVRETWEIVSDINYEWIASSVFLDFPFEDQLLPIVSARREFPA